MEYNGEVIVPLTTDQKLLFLILEELKSINTKLESLDNSIPLDEFGKGKL